MASYFLHSSVAFSSQLSLPNVNSKNWGRSSSSSSSRCWCSAGGSSSRQHSVFSYKKFVEFALDETKCFTHLVPSSLQVCLATSPFVHFQQVLFLGLGRSGELVETFYQTLKFFFEFLLLIRFVVKLISFSCCIFGYWNMKLHQLGVGVFLLLLFWEILLYLLLGLAKKRLLSAFCSRKCVSFIVWSEKLAYFCLLFGEYLYEDECWGVCSFRIRIHCSLEFRISGTLMSISLSEYLQLQAALRRPWSSFNYTN